MACGRKARFPPVLLRPVSAQVLYSVFLLLATRFVQQALKWEWTHGHILLESPPPPTYPPPSSLEVGLVMCSGLYVGGQSSNSGM